MTRLSALVVNYNSGDFAAGCVRSLQWEWEASGRDPADLEVVVVDNASPSDQESHLRRLEARGARVLRSRRNLGYAGGMNLCYEETSGGPADAVAILNPDLCFLPGSVDTMLGYLAEHPECGALDPRTFIDTSRLINLPRNLLPTPVEHTRMALAQRGGFWSRLYSRRRLQLNLEWWEADGPVHGSMLSGCCLFMRRGVVEEMGRVMDPAFPLYYEDTDLFRQLHRRGYRTVHHGGATVLHFWSRSSGVGQDFEADPRERYRRSMGIYYEKYYSRRTARLMARFDRVAEGWAGRPDRPGLHEFESLGAVEEPLRFSFPRSCRFVVELTMAPTFSLAVGILGEGSEFAFAAETWDWLYQGDYFARAVERPSGRFLGAWSFQKRRPGRNAPPDDDELRYLRGEVAAGSAAGGAAGGAGEAFG